MGLFHRRRQQRVGHELYCAAVAAARAPFFYSQLGVPDTLDGRFDMVGLHAFLVIRRVQELPPPGPDMAQAVFDAMFSDMDMNLREMGVGDLSVGKRVRAMWEAFHGRASAYQASLAAGDAAGLAAALARNVWRDPTALDPATRLAGIALAQDRHLAGQQDFASGRADFLAPERLMALDRIGPSGSEHLVEADPQECTAIAARLQIPAVLSLDCRFTLARRQDRVEATGLLRALVVRDCVVSLEPFEVVVQEDFRLRFVTPGTEEEDQDDPLSVDELPFTDAAVDLGEAAVQQLALALDPYPRRPDAVLPVGDDDSADAGAFAALARLRPNG